MVRSALNDAAAVDFGWLAEVEWVVAVVADADWADVGVVAEVLVAVVEVEPPQPARAAATVTAAMAVSVLARMNRSPIVVEPLVRMLAPGRNSRQPDGYAS
jgi:hypothetical protein